MINLSSIIIAFALGWVSQKLGLCLVLAIRRLFLKKPMLFITLASCGLIGMLLAPMYRFAGFGYPFYWPDASLWIIFAGGVIFGIGAALNNGCNLGTITRLTRGDSSMIITVFGWIIGEIIWRVGFLNDALKQLSDPIRLHDQRFLLGLFIIALPALLMWRRRREKRIWIYTTLLGLLASGLFITEPHWTPSSYVFDIARMTTGDVMIEFSRSMTFAALLLGMVANSVYHRTFDLRGFGWFEAFHHLFSGILMGIGAAMALGGNDSQILLVFPTLTYQAVVPLFSMCLGILIMVLIQRARKT